MAEELPVVRGPSVQPSGQEPGYLNVDYSPEAFGSGIGRALLQTGATFQDAARTEKFLSDQRSSNDALNATNEAKDQLRPWLFDPQDGIFSKKGGDAQGTGAQIGVVLDQIKDQQLKKITDPKAKLAFEKLWSSEADQTKDKVASHELTELQTYKADTSKGVLLSSMQDAYNYFNDPKAIEKAIKDTRVAIAANTMGRPPELTQEAEAEAISGIHLAVITRLATEDPGKALEYLNAHNKEISGQDHVQAAQLTKAGRTNQNAQRWLAERTSGGSGLQATHDLGDAMEMAESGGQGGLTSKAGALGVTQLIPSTAREVAMSIGRADIAHMSEDDLKQALLHDNDLNRRLGRAYLGQQLQKYHGDIEAALVAYNAGPQGADDFLKHNAGRGPGQRDYNVPGRPKIKSETEGYVQKVLGYYSGGAPNVTPPGTRMTAQNWTLKNFKPEDLTAPTPGGAWVDATAATALDGLVDKMKARFPDFQLKVNEDRDPNGVTAGRRRGTADPSDNPHVKRSQHLRGDAFDIQIQSWTPEQKAAFLTEARQAGFGGIGFYGPQGHLHIDMGKPRTWGTMPAWAYDAMNVKVGRPAGGGGGQAPYGNDLPDNSPGAPGTGLANMKRPALDQLLLESEQITDPYERERVQSQIRTYSEVQKAQDAQDKANVKQAAWNQLLQTGDFNSISPELQSLLGREETAGLRSYAESLAKGGVATDYNRLIQLKSMDQKDLAKVDINDERPHLNEGDTKEVVNLISAARAAENGDARAKLLMSGMRTRTEILSDAATAQGWNTKYPLGQQKLAALSQKLDDRIALETAASGKELNAVQLQDIVDKLLIKDKATNIFGFGGQGTAQNVTDPDNFVAASKWSDVQPDDQKQLQDTYEALWKHPPSQEEAVRLYNNAMVLYLGGHPEPSDDEAQLIMQALRAEGAQYPQKEDVERRYGRYLLALLGR